MKYYIFPLILALCLNVYGEVQESKAIRAMIGEASGEGYLGLLSIASGIRNRGTLKGVYGLNAPHIDKEPEWVWDMAKRAWGESKYNRTHEGDCWGSVVVDKRWLEKMSRSDKFIKVYEYKNHIFYKEK